MRLNWTRPFIAYLGDRLSLTADQQEIALYGLQIILYPAVTTLCICLAAWLLGCLGTTLAAGLAAVLLRLFAHGAHSRSPLTCTLTSVILFPALGKAAQAAAPLLGANVLLPSIMVGFILSLAAVWRLAPADSPAKPVASAQERRRLRLLSAIVTCGIAAAQAALLLFAKASTAALALGLGLWWQAFALTGAGHGFATLLDNLFGKGGSAI